jgi:nucleoside-diphosphate-sugar epimerase
MRVLFIGGSGIISSACTNLAIEQGVDLYHLNRGNSSKTRPVPAKVKQLRVDVRNTEQAIEIIGDLSFDAVVDWISFVPEHIENNFKILKDKVKQYVFISSASAYQTPPLKLPVTEETPLENPYWLYSRDKIDCEDFVKANAGSNGMNYTIVRPSHTYDKTLLPFDEGYTIVHRMICGKPVVVPGDGTSIWTLTNHRDFAIGLNGLLGNKLAENNVFHITSDEWLSWNQIYSMIGNAFGVEPKLIHVPAEVIARFFPQYGPGLLGDKIHSMIFDNAKIKNAVPAFNCSVPFSEGVKEISNWYKSGNANTKIDPEMDSLYDQIVEKITKINPE